MSWVVPPSLTWALVHGLATLLLSGNLPAEADPETLARSVAGYLFSPPEREGQPAGE